MSNSKPYCPCCGNVDAGCDCYGQGAQARSITALEVELDEAAVALDLALKSIKGAEVTIQVLTRLFRILNGNVRNQYEN